jgi:autotransporter translocation and assembly factor TamB
MGVTDKFPVNLQIGSMFFLGGEGIKVELKGTASLMYFSGKPTDRLLKA